MNAPSGTDTTLVACPKCGETDSLQELAFRYTWQPVQGLQRSGAVAEYDSFDYADDALVTGYACRSCGWGDGGDLDGATRDALGKAVRRVLDAMPGAAEQD